ncbi:MAG: glycoside hydrolase family 3 C-terminal domain-containing protein, partial [Blautia sp.]
IDMMTSVYAANLCKLVEAGEVDEKLIDESVMRVLELKNKLGLFENPYKDADPEKEKDIILCEEHRKLAREVAGKSFVLLKNEGLLPVDTSKKIAFIGPYTNNKEIISSWAITGKSEDCVTIEEAAREVFDSSRTTYLEGSPILSNEYPLTGFVNTGEKLSHHVSEKEKEEMLHEAVEAAKEADIVIMPLGEHFLQSGEATSRAMIDVPEIQMNLFREVTRVNENIIVVLFNGRPLDLREINQKAKSILEVWLPGTEGGHAIVDTLVGKVNPSGKLPMSFPYCVGQVPVYYNAYSTGRPNLPGLEERYRSKYIDIPNAPLYPFGYGLSYTKFRISPIRLSGTVVKDGEPVTAAVTVNNTGKMAGTQVVQLYIQDIAASVVRPVKELKGFKKVSLDPGEEKEISFVIDESMLRFLRGNGTVGSEDGEFRIWIGDSSITENQEKIIYMTINQD